MCIMPIIILYLISTNLFRTLLAFVRMGRAFSNVQNLFQLRRAIMHINKLLFATKSISITLTIATVFVINH